jgi:hypothetical protein
MDPMDIVTGLARIGPRGPGTDGERRAARFLQERLRDAGREAELEPEWVRPQWTWVHAMHAALGVVAGLVAISSPAVGLGILVALLVSSSLDVAGRAHLLRRLTPERATQNVVSPPSAATRGGRERVVRLIITAHYDAPRGGLVYRDAVRRCSARLRRVTRGLTPGPLAVVPLALAGLAVVAGARLAAAEPSWLGVAQLVPTVALLAALAAFVDIGLTGTVPGAGDPASGAAVALALADALDREPPRRLAVEVVMAGGGDGPALGMRAYVRGRRRSYAPAATALLHLAACGRGYPRWWVSDGALVPLRFHPRLAALAADAAAEERHLGAQPRRGRGFSGAYRARLARWPAITVGCLEDDSWAPGAHRPTDTAERVDPRALERALEFCLALVDRLDEDLGSAARR